MALTPEGKYKKKVMSWLQSQKDLYLFSKEAKAIRGIPDLVGAWNGHFFAIELKKSLAETRKGTGRIILQRYTIEQIKKAGGFAIISCPETFEEDMKLLMAHCFKP